jgi:hypothetical protein
MTEIKCTSCKNYHQKEGICTIEDEPCGHGMDVKQINGIWGITFQECIKYEVK